MRNSQHRRHSKKRVIKKGNFMRTETTFQTGRSSQNVTASESGSSQDINSFGIGFPNPPSQPAQGPIRVAIVDDNDSIRSGLAGLVRLSPDLSLAGLYCDAESLLRDIDAVIPEVLLLDLSLPGKSGLECLRDVKERLPKTQVIILTMDGNPDCVFSAIQSGASGYLTKATAPEQILNAIRDVRNGGAPMSSMIARSLVERVRKNSQPHARRLEDPALTPRENEVLRSVSEGYRAKEIAERLRISTFTVQAHIRNIYEKLGVRSLSQAIAKLSHFGEPSTH